MFPHSNALCVGAKGMLALDTRLRGDAVCLRPSMIKFEGSTSTDLEICESAYRPLPLFLCFLLYFFASFITISSAGGEATREGGTHC